MFCPTRTLNSNNKLSGRCAQKSQNKKGKSQQFGGSITTFLVDFPGIRIASAWSSTIPRDPQVDSSDIL